MLSFWSFEGSEKMANWSPSGYRSGSRPSAGAKKEIDRAARVRDLVAGGETNMADDERRRPPPRKSQNVEHWKYPIRKDGTRREGTYERFVRRFHSRFCLAETPEEKRAYVKEVRRRHALPRPRA